MEWIPANGLSILAGGSLIGFLLGLLGGGGSLLAVPLLLHLSGTTSPHLAIGTSAVAVSANAYFNSLQHLMKRHIDIPTALTFSACGLLTAIAGAHLGLGTPGTSLMVAFGMLTVAVGIWMIRKKSTVETTPMKLSRNRYPQVIIAGLGVGAMSGFFGIGGGFLAVPALIWATGQPLSSVVGTALVGVGTLGAGTALSYALAGQILWPVAALLLLGGIFGGQLGMLCGTYLEARSKSTLQYLFAAFIVSVGIYMIWQNL